MGIGYGIGYTGAKIPLKNEKVTYDELVLEVKKKASEINSLDKDKEAILSEISKHQEDFDEALKASKKRKFIR
ncbi:hypothetical protein KSU66_19350 [Sporosarcina sp. G11-34]|nr:hypothetical protein [Sporosarcina sp. G11-34]